jgi:putative FmdB family regulatory protein
MLSGGETPITVTSKGGTPVPTYEYQCDGCSYQFEVKQSIKDAPLTTCERCGKALRRLISSPGIMFKGSGWYVTDYSNKLKPPSEGEKSPTPPAEKKETSTEASTTAAPASASPSAAPASTPSSSAPAAANPSTTNTSNK